MFPKIPFINRVIKAPQERRSVEKPQRPADALPDELHALRDANRLGLHMWESGTTTQPSPYAFPEFSRKLFQNASAEAPDNDRFGILSALNSKAEKNADDSIFPINVMSLSLLPNASGGRALKPYGSNMNLGYLVDLTQDEQASSRILRAFPHVVGSGFQPNKKTLSLHEGGWPLGSDDSATPGQFGGDSAEYFKQLADPIMGRAHSEAQLDSLAAYMDKTQADMQNLKPLRTNEVIAAVGQSQIKAIVVPWRKTKPETAQASAFTLAGALAGLTHLDHGIDLPVVTYRMHIGHELADSPETPVGGFTVIGRGAQQLNDVAIHAASELHTQLRSISGTERDELNKEVPLKPLRQALLDRFDIDLLAPNKQFDVQLGRALDKARSSQLWG